MKKKHFNVFLIVLGVVLAFYLFAKHGAPQVASAQFSTLPNGPG
jgi:hypothetical protein